MSTLQTSGFAPMVPQIEGANFLNLLIVDDERAIREVCRDVAQSMGFNTHIADSAEHAYRMLDPHGIDVVLLDLKLPGAGGLEALHQIHERRPDVVVIVVTGYGTGPFRRAGNEKRRLRLCHEAFQHGRTEAIAKPRGKSLEAKDGEPGATRED